jgi:hypothetical protein
MNILMEKKKSGRVKGRMRVGKGIIDYSFKKLSFGEELGELARVSAGNPSSVLGFGSETICPSREIGEAIQGSHLQVLAL